MIMVGTAISLLIDHILPFDNPDNLLYDILFSIFITIIVWEGNLYIDDWMNSKIPWLLQPRKRIVVHITSSIAFTAFNIYLFTLLYSVYICKLPDNNKGTIMVFSLVIGMLVSVIVLAVEISSQFFKHWKN